MNLKQKIQTDFKNALKEKKELKTSVLRMLMAAITNQEIKLGKKNEGLDDQETEKAIASEAKKRKDSIEAYRQGGRNDMAENEEKELSILKTYLPEEMSDKETEKIAKEAIVETDAQSMKDFGTVMKTAMAKAQGKAEGDKMSQAVKKILNG